MKAKDVVDLTSYLAILRTQVATHGRESVTWQPSDDRTKIGFKSPDGWWVFPVSRVYASCVVEEGSKRVVGEKTSYIGKYAPREAVLQIDPIEWFSNKLGEAINAGQKVYDNFGVS